MKLKYIDNDGKTQYEFEGTISDLVLSVERMLMNALPYEKYKEVSKFIGTKGIASREIYEAYQGTEYERCYMEEDE